MTTLKCRNAKNTGSLQKNEVLKQTTYQTCKYVSYLEYLKEQSEKLSYYLKDLDNYNKDKAREELSKNYSPEKIDNMIDDYYDKKVEIKQANVYDSFRSKEFQKRMIQEEIDHTYNIFPLAFHAYSEYENSIVIHFLLETIKQDYIAVRDRLHKVINPINQVVYKVSNAMKK